MQFLGLRQLKSQLRAGDLPPVEVARYAGGQAVLGAVLFVPTPADVPADWAFVTFPLLALGGVFYCYRCNGASQGPRFAERYLALSWVVGWRIGLVAAAVVMLAVLAGLLSGGFAWLEHESVPDGLNVVTLLLIAFIYWRIGANLRDVQGPDPDRAQ